jgi:cephalosporin-C deacetylase-like acetyl esterase
MKALFADGPVPALSPKLHSTFEPTPGVLAERITYSTQYNMRVPVILYRPKTPAAKAPAIVIVNGHRGDKYSWYPIYAGMLYAKAGAFVLTYDPTGKANATANASPARAHDKVEPIPELGQRLGGLMLTDVMQAVSYLSARSEVDPNRIAAVATPWAHSY